MPSFSCLIMRMISNEVMSSGKPANPRAGSPVTKHMVDAERIKAHHMRADQVSVTASDGSKAEVPACLYQDVRGPCCSCGLRPASYLQGAFKASAPS